MPVLIGTRGHLPETASGVHPRLGSVEDDRTGGSALYTLRRRDVAQPGSALALGARSRGFKFRRPDCRPSLQTSQLDCACAGEAARQDGSRGVGDRVRGLGDRRRRGETDDRVSLAAMGAAVDAGVTFFDTADVYGDGRSERLIATLLRERSEPLVVATKFGRRGPLEVAAYSYENLRSWLERSRENLGVDVVDLVQLHCPPWETYYTPKVFESCDRLVEEGLVRAYGVSVQKVEEALKAIEYPGVATVQIIFNIFRQRPAELFFERARLCDIGVIVRVPLASGLLTGKFRRGASFAPDDHRAYNRNGERFDVGGRSPASISSAGSKSSRSCGRSCRRGRPWPNSRCAGSWASRLSRRSSRAPRRLSRRTRTLPRQTFRRCPTTRCGRSQRSIAAGSHRRCITAGSRSLGRRSRWLVGGVLVAQEAREEERERREEDDCLLQ